MFVPNPVARADELSAPTDETGHTLAAAVRTPVFWVFGVATSLYGLIAAGVSLFNQSILAERNFDRSVFLTVTTLAPMIGLAANLATGWLATRIAMGRLLAVAMVVMAAALLAFPWVSSLTEVYAYATAMGVAGGMVTVLFFAVWRQAFGTKHLGQIQGAAQLLTVLGSAADPVLLAARTPGQRLLRPSFRISRCRPRRCPVGLVHPRAQRTTP
ncbi:MAG: MFS transporter [Gemmataceae bacterium]